MPSLGTGIREGLAWRQIETVNDTRGKPGIELSGKAAGRAAELGVTRIHVSISDLETLTAATVILEGETPNPADAPPGCAFQDRCPLVHDRCRSNVPMLEPFASGHDVECFAVPTLTEAG